MMDAIRAGNALLADVPDDARVALDRYDRDGSALVLGSFFHELAEVAGRACLAFRPPEWVALEDKVVVDALWDRAGVAGAPSEIVAVERSTLIAAARRLDVGRGTVWVGDSREGYHGGGEYARWVRTDADVDEATAFLARRCDQARVMPFLEGIPCSIHGLVFADDVVALRPVEMVTLRRPDSPQLFYAGAASYWDPSSEDRQYMRGVAQRVGQTLREEVNFRGAFTIDGVMTDEGFRPTELNPRFGAGLRTLTRGLPVLPLELLHDTISADIPLDYRPRELEALIVERADAKRGGGTSRAVPSTIEAMLGRSVVGDSRGYRWAAAEEPADGWAQSGPSALGGFVRLTLNASRTPNGPSIASRAAAFYRFTDHQLGTAIGPLQAAQPVR